jgi:hypothetical protein
MRSFGISQPCFSSSVFTVRIKQGKDDRGADLMPGKDFDKSKGSDV